MLQLPLFQTYNPEIINLNGQVVEQLSFIGKVKTLQPKHLSKGIYWLQAKGQNEKRYVSRLVWLE